MDVIPEDILLQIAASLGVSDVQNLRHTCRQWHAATTIKQLWVQLLRRDIRNSHATHVPTYCRPIDTLSSKETETLVMHCLRTLQNMSTPQGKEFWKVIPLSQPRSVTWVKLVLGQWLLFASSDLVSSKLTLCSLATDRSKHEVSVACQVSLRAPVADGLVEVQDGQMVIALYLRGRPSSIDVLCARSHGKQIRIVRVSECSYAAHIRFLCGEWIGFALYREISLPHVVNWKTNTVHALYPRPGFQGCCLGMAMDKGHLAVLMPRRLEIHTKTGSSPMFRLWRAIEIPVRKIGSAVLSRVPSNLSANEHPASLTPSFRIIITCEQGLYLYDVHVDVSRGYLELSLRWHNPPFKDRNYTMYPVKPQFASTVNTFSWLEAASYDHERYPRFAAATVPVGSSEPSFRFSMKDPDEGTQYAVGVRDYDEGRGAAVFGNAFGELVVYVFSGRSSPVLHSCFLQAKFLPSRRRETLLSDSTLRSIPAPPFPYAGSRNGEEEHLQHLFAIWRQEPTRAQLLPAGWENSEAFWPVIVDTADLIYRMLSPLSTPCLLENVHHYLGEPILLMYYQGGEWVMFAAGGLLFLLQTEDGILD
ncbi:hypothetical protein K474DRAFT_1773431 [Panus rudis PR-1116 ss-1]|nr:hypothetical protein K474DRAFT_1773431 [Panus rudis PR-1116 ss-1]